MARTNVPALANFIGAIIQAEQLGVSISKVLQVQSEPSHRRTIRHLHAFDQLHRQHLARRILRNRRGKVHRRVIRKGVHELLDWLDAHGV